MVVAIGAHAVASLPQGLNVETYPGLKLKFKNNEIFDIENGILFCQICPVRP